MCVHCVHVWRGGSTVCVYDGAKLHTHCFTKRYTLCVCMCVCVWYELKELNYTFLVRLIHIVCVHVLVCVNTVYTSQMTLRKSCVPVRRSLFYLKHKVKLRTP